jgi:hypothetical protein
LLGLTATARAQVSLRWKFKEGESFYVEEKGHSKQTVKEQGSETVLELELRRVTRFKVLKMTPDGGAVLEQKFESVKVLPAGPANKAQAEAVRHLEGATFTVTLDGRGHVTKLDGYEKLVEALKNKNADDAKLVRTVLPEDMIRQHAETIFGFGPEKPVSRGDSWRVKFKQAFGPLGTLDVTDAYQLQNNDPTDKDVVKVTLSRTVSYSLPKETAGLSFKITSGDVKVKEFEGNVLFNTASGRVVERQTRQALRGVFALAVGESRLEMEIDQVQTNTARVLDRNPLPKAPAN